MKTANDLFGAPLVLRTGAARTWAVARLIALGHPIPARLQGRARVLALYTDPDCTRAVLMRATKTGAVSTVRYGTLTKTEIAFLHSLASTVPAGAR